MTLPKLLPALALISILQAQEEWKPGVPVPEATSEFQFGEKALPEAPLDDDSPILIPELKKLIIRDQGEELAGRFPGLLNRTLTENGLNFLIESIHAHYDAQGQPVVDVIVPEQDISQGSLLLEVVEGRVGKVGLQKTKHFNATLLGKGIHLKSGDLIFSKNLQRDLDWLSRNPFRKATLLATPGDQPATGDFLFGLEEQRPWRVFTSFQNTGTEAIGEDLFSAGFNWGNAFAQDHLLNYQFTTGADPGDFLAHTFSWDLPLHQSHHFLRLSAARADVQSEENGIDSEGGYRELGLSIGRQLDRWHGLRQEASLALEWKNIDNFATFGEASFPGAEVDLWQLHLSYRASGILHDGRFNLKGDVIVSPGYFSGKNSDSDFELFRDGADSQYTILRASSGWQGEIQNDWTLNLAVQGQFSPDRLLPSEQLGLGGYATVRGYSEREFLADSGLAFSAQIGSPVQTWNSFNFQAVGFLDHATGWRHGEGHETLTGAGFGLRVGAGGALDGRVDWAVSREGESQWHLGLLINF